MRSKLTLGRILGACAVIAAFGAQADDGGQGPKSATPAMQVQIDSTTGQKTLPDDSPRAANPPAATARSTTARTAKAAPAPDLAAVAARLGTTLESQAPVRNADGALSARVGLRNMEYLVMRIDANGKRVIAHETVDGSAETAAADAGEK